MIPEVNEPAGKDASQQQINYYERKMIISCCRTYIRRLNRMSGF